MLCSCKAAGKSCLKVRPTKSLFARKERRQIVKRAHVCEAKDWFFLPSHLFFIVQIFLPISFSGLFLGFVCIVFLFSFFFFSCVPFFLYVPLLFLPFCIQYCSFIFLFRFCFLCFFSICLFFIFFRFFRLVLSLFIFFLFRSFFMFLLVFLLSIFVLGFYPFYTTLGKLATSCYAHYLLHSCAPCSLICFLFYMTCDVGRHIANYRATDIEATNWNNIYIYYNICIYIYSKNFWGFKVLDLGVS